MRSAPVNIFRGPTRPGGGGTRAAGNLENIASGKQSFVPWIFCFGIFSSIKNADVLMALG